MRAVGLVNPAEPVRQIADASSVNTAATRYGQGRVSCDFVVAAAHILQECEPADYDGSGAQPRIGRSRCLSRRFSLDPVVCVLLDVMPCGRNQLVEDT